MYKQLNVSNWVIVVGLLLVLGGFSHAVWQKERLLVAGEQAFVRLAPVDPRSLMQGDYMVLNYAIPNDVERIARKQHQGKLVYQLDQHQVMKVLRVASDNEVLQHDEKMIQFRYRKRRVQLGANSFFFQEGKATVFEQAKFGEVRVAANGEAILVGLRDEKYQLLGMSSGL